MITSAARLAMNAENRLVTMNIMPDKRRGERPPASSIHCPMRAMAPERFNPPDTT